MPPERFKITPASYLIILNNKNEILLGLRQNTGYRDGEYAIPAGHVEEGESFTECLAREIQEEINLSIDIKKLRPVHIMHRLEELSEESDKSQRQRIDVFYILQEWSGEIKNNEPHKCVHLKWFPINNLPANIFPYTKFAIEQYRKGIMFSEYGFKNS
jgi:8-oxo-dGTP diphosphatase